MTQTLVKPKSSKKISTTALAPRTGYEQLKRQVRDVFLMGRARIEREKVETYWRAGKLIQENILANGNRAEYGKQIISNLSGDLGINKTVLHKMVQFALKFPIVAARRQLSWAHYRAVLSVQDQKQRKTFLLKAEQYRWSSRELERAVLGRGVRANPNTWGQTPLTLRPGRMLGGSDPTHIIPKRGTVGTYQIISRDLIHLRRSGTSSAAAAKGNLWVDLGFHTYHRLTAAQTKRFTNGDIVECSRGKSHRIEKSKKAKSDLFTYEARVERVVDGDTLRVQIDLGFQMMTRQYLRLRGINTPELGTPEGKRAKKFVASELANVGLIVLQSTRSDKYDRYLSDVFYAKDGREVFLNRELLDRGFAVRVHGP